ncbi:hypothetical protein DL240_06120 [Lujinxingia litoralis]|uniref:Uncharacterized protein n=2 Tax=Lujinxingia litoralis TaxID=2211119 RepID=A0A328CCT6_9DELT|nr:hypothetical protein DL240_06120 [Lujinxingia litoralis]
MWRTFGPPPQPDWAAEDAAQIRSGSHFPALSVDVEHLAASRQAHYHTVELSSDQRAQHHALMEAVVAANRAQFTDAEAIDARALQGRIDTLSSALLPATGPRGFVPLAEPTFEACASGLEELLDAIRRGALTLHEASTAPPAKRFESYRDHCGNVLPMLRERALITEDARWSYASSPYIFSVLQRYRFADIIHTRQPLRLQLAPYELQLLTRWRIEDPNAFDVRTRRRHLARATDLLPDYDVPLARTRLDAHGKALSEALPHFRDLVESHPDTPRYRDLLRELEHQAAQTPKN